MLRDLLWLGKALLFYALLCASGFTAVALCHRLAAWWRGRRVTRIEVWTRPAERWQDYHIIWQTPPPSLIDDPHGPARCRCAHCQARRAATR